MPLKSFFIRSAFAFFCLIICTSAVFAQDEAYIQTYEDTMNLKFITTNRSLNTALEHSDRDERMKLAPDNRSYLGIGGFVWGIGFQFHLPMPVRWFFDKERSRDSRMFDFQGTLFRNKWLLDGGYQVYRNLYISNASDFAGSEALMAGEQFDLRRMLGTVTYVFQGDRISFKSAFNLNHRQLQSMGSWLITAGYASVALESKSPTAPPDPMTTEEDLPSRIRGLSFVLRPGYGYQFVHRNFFVHTSAAAGLALQYQTYTQGELNQNGWGVVPTYNLRGSLGYDNGRYFASLLGVFYHTSLDAGALRLTEDSHNIQLMVGYRFAEPKWLREAKPAFLEKFQ